MATQILANAVTSDGAQTGVSHSGPATIIVHRDSVFDGAEVVIEVADSDTAADYVSAKSMGVPVIRTEGAYEINGRGTHYLRAVVAGSGDNTSITIKTTQ